MKFMYSSVKCRFSDILLIKNTTINFILLQPHLLQMYWVNMVSVTSRSRYITSASRYHPRNQRCQIPWNFDELAEAVPIWEGGV